MLNNVQAFTNLFHLYKKWNGVSKVFQNLNNISLSILWKLVFQSDISKIYTVIKDSSIAKKLMLKLLTCKYCIKLYIIELCFYQVKIVNYSYQLYQSERWKNPQDTVAENEQRLIFLDCVCI